MPFVEPLLYIVYIVTYGDLVIARGFAVLTLTIGQCGNDPPALKDHETNPYAVLKTAH